jgi:hypothetical protein
MGGIVVEVNFNTDIPRNLMYLIENQKTYIEKLFHTGQFWIIRYQEIKKRCGLFLMAKRQMKLPG